MKIGPGTTQYAKSWWWKSEIINNVMYSNLGQDSSEQQTQSMPVSGTQEEVDCAVRICNEGDEEDESEENYGMFKNVVAKTVWPQYSTIKKGKRREGGDEDQKYSNLRFYAWAN